MATELRILGATAGSTVKAVISRDSDEKVWSTATSAWVTRVNADYANYAVAMTETPASSAVWLGDMPSGISSATRVNVEYYKLAGATLVYTDTLLGGETMWPDGSSVSAVATDKLVTVADYKASKGITSSADDDQYDLLIQMATSAIEDYCQTKFTSQTITDYLDGTGTNYLKLTAVPSSITSLTEDPYGSTPTSHTVSDVVWTTNGLLYWKESATQSQFGAGFRNWKVVYDIAPSIPKALQMACILVADGMLLKGDPDIAMTEKKVGDVTIKWDLTPFADPLDPVFSDARMLLAPYKQFVVV